MNYIELKNVLEEEQENIFKHLDYSKIVRSVVLMNIKIISQIFRY